ncbi:MAG: hypothetical protein ACUVQP_11325, partial [Bacteroidales bacterium]
QLYFFRKSKKDCAKLARLFPDAEDEKGDKVLRIENIYIDNIIRSVSQIILSSNYRLSENFFEIVESTNRYLKNNVDTTAEFNILKDIAERISESEENKIYSTISLPLYIGLMGTFIGVIFGIINIVISNDEIGSSIITEQSIKAFLSGVFIAMIGSLFGLLLTTINYSYFFRKAKAERDHKKNIYFNFLQVELLPTLENSLSKSLKDFRENLILFNKEFSVNISEFKGTIPSITDNLKIQTEFIEKFKEIDIPQLAEANIKIFNKLNKSTELFKEFYNYSISINKSISNADVVLEKLINLLNRLVNFENNINLLGERLKESDENYEKAVRYWVEKLESIKNRYQLITEFVDKSEDEIKFIANKSIDGIKALSQSLEKQFDEVFRFSSNNNPFSKLELIENLNQNLLSISEKLDNIYKKLNLTNEPNDLAESIKLLNQSLIELKNSIRPSIFRPIKFIKFIFSRNSQ